MKIKEIWIVIFSAANLLAITYAAYSCLSLPNIGYLHIYTETIHRFIHDSFGASEKLMWSRKIHNCYFWITLFGPLNCALNLFPIANSHSGTPARQNPFTINILRAPVHKRWASIVHDCSMFHTCWVNECVCVSGSNSKRGKKKENLHEFQFQSYARTRPRNVLKNCRPSTWWWRGSSHGCCSATI